MYHGNHPIDTARCAVEIIPSHIILYQTFPIFMHKKPKEILIHWFYIAQFLALDFLLIINPFVFDANLVLILCFPYQSFPRPGGEVCLCPFMSSVSSCYSQPADVKTL